MSRGPQPERPADSGRTFTKQELLDASGLSAKTFDTIRKAARVRGPGHGGRNWEFSETDLHALIHRAQSGSFSERGAPAADAWLRLLQSPSDD
jgi:hypothetical protein